MKQVVKTLTGRPGRAAFRIFQVTFVILAQLVAPLAGFFSAQPALAAGGSYTLNFAAADPSIYIPPIPFPSDLTAPTGRADGDPLIPLAEFNDGVSDVRVESLAPEDMALGQIVPFELEISTLGDTTPENGVITFVIGWNTLTTNGDNFGYDARNDDVGYGVIGAFIDIGDGAHFDPGNDATVDSFTWSLINDEIVGVFTVSGLDSGDVVVLEPWLVLDDTIGPGVGGNVQSRLIDAATGSDQTINVANSGAITLVNGDSISTGNQTVPLLKPSDFFNANVDVSVTKTDDPDPVDQGETLTYTITASNAGPSVANTVVVYDVLDPNVTFVSASDGGFINTDIGDTIPDGAVQWNVGALAPGDTVVFTVIVTVNNDAPTNSPTGEDLINLATVTTISDDTNLDNNTDTEPTDVLSAIVPAPSLSLSKQISTSESGPWSSSINVTAGDPVYYQFTINNTGDAALSPVSVNDPDVSTASCTFDDPLPVGGSTSCVVGPITALEGTHTNTATASGGYGGETYNSGPSSATYFAAAQVFPPDITLTKTADPTSVDEPGGNVSFTILVVNNSSSDATLDSLNDSVYGNLNGKGDCSVPQPLAANGGSYTCSFTAFVSGNAADVHTNIATAVASNAGGSDTASDDATVTLNNVPSAIEIIKTANPTSVDEPGANVTFSFTINNLSAVDAVTINSLSDTVYGDLNSQGDCAVPQTIPAGGSYSCSFVAFVSASETNVVTASGLDDDGYPVFDDDDATVTYNDVPSSILTTKTASPTSVPETGGEVTFSIVVENTSAVDTVTINAVVDSAYGDVSASCAPALPVNLMPGESITCSFTEFISGDFPGSHTNVATASGVDDDGNPVSDDDQEVVPFEDILPDIAITKTANPASVPETGGNVTFTFVATNNSLEAATLDSLVDNIFGDLNSQGDCALPQPLAANGGSYSCSITVFLSADNLAPHTNVVTATASDDDGNTGTDTDDETVTFTDVAPQIALTKSASPSLVAETGGDVAFTFTVENIGQEDVTLTSLTDTVFGDLNGQGTCMLPQSILIGGSYSCSITVSISADDLADHYNVATATAADDDGTQAQDSDDETVTFEDVLPDINITKTADPTSVPETGGNVTFTFLVTNNSLEAATIDSLVDSDFGDLNGQGDCSVPQALVGSSGTYSCSIKVFLSGDASGPAHNNVVTATASDNDGNSDSASDDETVTFTDVLPDIMVIKTADQNQVFAPGENVEFTIVVTNNGLEDATIDQLYDSDYDLAANCPDAVGTVLGSGESYTCIFTEFVGSDHENTVTVVASDNDGNSDTESATEIVEMINPSLDIEKLTNGFDADTAPGPEILASASVIWEYVVTNDGDVDLTNITVSDNVLGSVCTIDFLAPGDSTTCTMTGTAAAGQYANTGSANTSYTDADGDTANRPDSDDSHYFGAQPSLSIDKTTADAFGNEGDALGTLPGETVTWNYLVTNTGNVPLSNVSVSDNQGVTVICPQDTLAVGESMTCAASGIAAAGWYENVGTVSGDYSDDAGNSTTVTDSDGSSYYGLTPGVVTNSMLCDFGDQFRLIFTPDMGRFTSSTPYYKLSDSNPGQFFYNVFYVNDGSTDTITMEIPYPFVTQGANPVHVYGGLFVNDSGYTCFDPTNELAAYGYTFGLGDYTDTNGDGVVGFGDVYLVEVPAELGFQYINIHLDYGLEKTDGWLMRGANATSDGTGRNPAPAGLSINDNTAHTFKAYADGVLIPGSTDTVRNLNEFKQIRGFGGLVQYAGSLDGVVGAQVQLIGSNGSVIETMTTDGDGWYLSNYVHRGRTASYTLKLVSTGETIVVSVGGNVKFGEGNFLVP